jgi:hypothetical protein
MASHFLAIRGRPANGDDIPALMTAACLTAGCWLLAEWPPRRRAHGLLAGHPPRGHPHRSSWPRSGGGSTLTGWHRHLTLAPFAQAVCAMLRTDPKVPAPG